MNALEHAGSLYIENQRLLAEYRKLLELIQRIKDESIPIDSVTVDCEKLTWNLTINPNES